MAPHREIQIEDAQGRSVALADLADGDRDQVYLAFCVALSANCARRGQHMPLMLNAVFNHFPAHSMRHVLEVLGEFARNHQIICFTRFEHVVETARACGIPVHHLAGGVARGSGDETEPARSDEPHVARAVASPAANIATGSQESPEELFHLHEDDPVEWTPSIGPAHAERLRKIGVLRVGDLLRVDPAEVAADLQRHGVSADLVNSWRAHARLVCSVRGLRPYDARLLVACGIRDPQQLAETPPARLRATIKEFLATTEGRELLTSGTEEELARVTEWVRQKSRSRRLPAGSDPNARTAQVAAKTRPASPRTRKGRRPARPAEINNSSKGPPQSGTAEAATIMQHPAAAPQRDGLQLSDPVRCAPSIGPVMAQRLEQVGIVTIRDLLAAQPDAVAAQVGIVRLTADTITRWQQQADLASQIPTLQEQGSQLLVGAGINSVGDLASQSPPELHVRIQRFAETVAGKRLLRSKAVPTIGEVTEWIHAARGVRSANAA